MGMSFEGITLAVLVAGVMLLALILYALLGGADYGGGLWDLLAFGPRAAKQRKLIEEAIGPVWEANHVWLIYILVTLFTAFPPVFAAVSTALHIPFTLLLIGIVLRGTAFVFRHYDVPEERVQRRWSRVFGIASLIAPLFLGVSIGAIMTGEIRVSAGVVTSGFLRPWFGVFPFAVGLFTVVLFAFLAAVYLTLEADDRTLREDFRTRALVSAVLVGAFAWGLYLLARSEAPLIHAGLSRRPWSVPFHSLTGLFALGAIAALWRRHFVLARVCAALQVGMIILGWGLAQYPYLLPPDFRIADAAAPAATLRLFLTVTAAGGLVLFPSLYYLFRIFKGSTLTAPEPPAGPRGRSRSGAPS